MAQILTASGYKLYYHAWPTASGKHSYEIDFLLSQDPKLVPIEVKSSVYKTHASLDAFCGKLLSRLAKDRYLIYTKDYAKDGNVTISPHTSPLCYRVPKHLSIAGISCHPWDSAIRQREPTLAMSLTRSYL